jgi:Sulfotransferase family
VDRWADCTPDHLLNIPEIHEQVPGAYVIHIIRDGRDVALSYVQQRWSHPLPWDRHEHLAVAGMYWEWVVRKGREYGRMLGPNYCEVRFEDLVAKPREVLSKLGEFIGHDLDYDKIQQAGIGAVSEPNSSFSGESGQQSFQPAGRWKRKMSSEDVARFEAVVGGFLRELGYEVSGERNQKPSLRTFRLRSTYMPMFAIKRWLKSKTPLGRLVNLRNIGIANLSNS